MKRLVSRVAAYMEKLLGVGFKAVLRGRWGKTIALAAVGSLLVLGLMYVWTTMRLVQIGYEIVSLEKKNNALKNRKRELLLEIASLQSPGELEKQARQKTNLVFPSIGKVVHVP
jgi:cell division protein FtsL